MRWSLAAEKKECSGSEKPKGKLQSVDACASKCKGEASMFIFGTEDFGDSTCNTDGCNCYCETSATEQGMCDMIDHNGYRLYRYTSGDYHTLYNKTSLLTTLIAHRAYFKKN